MDLLKQPITETSNELTKDIDLVDALGVLRMLRQSDAQLFSGYSNVPGIYDDELLQIIHDVTRVCVDLMKDDSNSEFMHLIESCINYC
jgi:hypothetical protein